MWMRIINFVGYQALWFALVIGASRGTTALPVIAACAFVAMQIPFGSDPMADVRRLIVAVAFGTLVDGVPSLLGWWHYASPSPALPTGGAPLWILALWASFATTIDRSLRVVQSRPWLGVLLGAIGGPLAYEAAARGWQAVVFTCPPALYLGWLGVNWAIAMALLARGVSGGISGSRDR
jgi:hypothetical protein